ncbi:MAG TPA: 2-succinyl-5-enolpyruvyl-6-hydroxy-3-cyclohexene-1-carboxylic-acid synthase [Chloroflexota bacterium]|nr:2-succinyl-5-enolpyruvyl-6-hydroxy-3-cyclohexene-1-carboxylic-acid synthase [Chloroflexota bacterium]
MSATTVAHANDLVVGALVDELVRSGVRHACLCPGSRSTPVALKLANHPRLRLWTHLDERSASFFGLGLAKASRGPVVLLATSGTAAAEFFPAIVEAFYSRVPLVVITADRPRELRDRGAPQTIDQLHLYGRHAKWFFDLPEPDLSSEHVSLARTVAARAVATALEEPAGPVHVNVPLREPLVPSPHGLRMPAPAPIAVTSGPRAPTSGLLDDLAEQLASPRGLIVCGAQDDPEFPAAVAHMARRVQYPILADPLSGVRCGSHDRSLVLDAYDALLRGPIDLAPEVVVRFGAAPTSKPLQQYLQQHPAAHHVLVDGGAGWRDPLGLSTHVLHVDARLLCRALAEHLPLRAPPPWATDWLRRDRLARAAIADYLATLDEPFEGAIFCGLASLLPEKATIFAGNSMPVRDMDTFLPGSPRNWRVLSNRGANGIDGVVSSALGASAVGGGPVVLVIGDISFYHDLNGLLAARQHGLDLLVVLVHNDGGGIFSFLPQAEHPEHFELLFGTPHGLDFQPFVEGYGGRFVRLEDWRSFGMHVSDALERGGLRVLEVRTERQRNVQLHRHVWGVVADALAPAAVG